MHTLALLALLAAIVALVAVLSAPEAGRGGYPGNYGQHGAVSSSTKTIRLSADPELDSKVSEYIAHQRTRSPSSHSTETQSPTSRGSTIVSSETTTIGNVY